MKKYLLLSLLLLAGSIGYAQVIQQGPSTIQTGCSIVHKDAAVNTAVTVVVPAPPGNQYVYICGWDWQAAQDATGGALSNVLFTTTNLNGLADEVSAAAGPSTLATGSYLYGRPIKASTEGLPVTFISPAAAIHTAYSINVFYFFAP